MHTRTLAGIAMALEAGLLLGWIVGTGLDDDKRYPLEGPNEPVQTGMPTNNGAVWLGQRAGGPDVHASDPAEPSHLDSGTDPDGATSDAPRAVARRRSRAHPGGVEAWAELLFQQLDRNGDGILNTDEMTPALRSALDRWDTNHDGTIDSTEFLAYFRARVQQERAGPSAADPVGAMEPGVFALAATLGTVALPGGGPGGPLDWFRQLDPHNLGQVSLYDWKASGLPVALFSQIDRNHDGYLTIAEVQAYQALVAGGGPAINIQGKAKIASGAKAPTPAPAPATTAQKLEKHFVAAAATGAAPRPTTPARVLAASPPPAAPALPVIPSATTASPISGAGMGGAVWARRQQQNLDVEATGHADLVLLGDSITDLLATGVGQPIWQQYFTPLDAMDLAVSGITTSQVLWQIETGQVAAVTPRVIVLMIGTNNLGLGQSVDDTVAGITDVVTGLQAQLPTTKILLLGLLPRGQSPGAPLRTPIAQVNARLAPLADGNQVHYLDIGANFLQSDGSISPTVLGDYLHPTLFGYEIYTGSIWPTLMDLLGEGGVSKP